MLKYKLDLYRLVSLALSPLMNERGEAGSGDGKGNETITVKVGDEEKQFSAEDVSNLLAQQGEATKRSQQVASVLDLAARYGVSVEDLVHNAEGSFGLMAKLVDEGIINDKGEIIKKSSEGRKTEEESLFRTGDPSPGGDKKFEVAAKALMEPFEERLKRLEETNARLRSDNTNLMRLRISDRIETAYPDFTQRDIAAVFSRAEQERDKSILDHAKDVAEEKKAEAAEQEAKFAKKYGIDIEKAKENQIFEQDPTGAAAGVIGEKKVSFKRGKDSVTPAQASKDFLEKFQGFRP